jgi:hypothetical protein
MSQPIGISPMVDFVFKLLLGSPEHAAVTMHFLRAIIGARFQIRSVEFRNPDLGKSYDDDKWVILDILVTDDLQIHLLQLTYLRVTRENLMTATPIERWAFFLLNAEQLSEAELRDLFPEPEFAEAIGVLKVINETPEKMHEYNSRLKLQLDEAARMDYAMEKGLEKGREEGEKKGELIGRIMILQELLGVTDPTRDELSRYELSRLTELAEQRRLQLRTRGE